MYTLIDLHLSSVTDAGEKHWRVCHCSMVSWLVDKFKEIKKGNVTYSMYVAECKAYGIYSYNEGAFNDFKNLQFPTS